MWKYARCTSIGIGPMRACAKPPVNSASPRFMNEWLTSLSWTNQKLQDSRRSSGFAPPKARLFALPGSLMRPASDASLLGRALRPRFRRLWAAQGRYLVAPAHGRMGGRNDALHDQPNRANIWSGSGRFPFGLGFSSIGYVAPGSGCQDTARCGTQARRTFSRASAAAFPRLRDIVDRAGISRGRNNDIPLSHLPRRMRNQLDHHRRSCFSIGPHHRKRCDAPLSAMPMKPPHSSAVTVIEAQSRHWHGLFTICASHLSDVYFNSLIEKLFYQPALRDRLGLFQNSAYLHRSGVAHESHLHAHATSRYTRYEPWRSASVDGHDPHDHVGGLSSRE